MNAGGGGAEPGDENGGTKSAAQRANKQISEPERCADMEKQP
jgi:hypothetical protein